MGNHELKLDVWKSGTNLVKVSVDEEGKLLSMQLVTIVDIEKIYVEADGKENSIYYNVNPIHVTDDSEEFTTESGNLMTLDGFINKFKGEMLKNIWTDKEIVDIWMCQDEDVEDYPVEEDQSVYIEEVVKPNRMEVGRVNQMEVKPRKPKHKTIEKAGN